MVYWLLNHRHLLQESSLGRHHKKKMMLPSIHIDNIPELKWEFDEYIEFVIFLFLRKNLCVYLNNIGTNPSILSHSIKQTIKVTKTHRQCTFRSWIPGCGRSRSVNYVSTRGTFWSASLFCHNKTVLRMKYVYRNNPIPLKCFWLIFNVSKKRIEFSSFVVKVNIFGGEEKNSNNTACDLFCGMVFSYSIEKCYC